MCAFLAKLLPFLGGGRVVGEGAHREQEGAHRVVAVVGALEEGRDGGNGDGQRQGAAGMQGEMMQPFPLWQLKCSVFEGHGEGP